MRCFKSWFMCYIYKKKGGCWFW